MLSNAARQFCCSRKPLCWLLVPGVGHLLVYLVRSLQLNVTSALHWRLGMRARAESSCASEVQIFSLRVQRLCTAGLLLPST